MKHTNPRHRTPRLSAIQRIEEKMRKRKTLGLKSDREIRKAGKIGVHT
jgi:hypothetical protein